MRTRVPVFPLLPRFACFLPFHLARRKRRKQRNQRKHRQRRKREERKNQMRMTKNDLHGFVTKYLRCRRPRQSHQGNRKRSRMRSAVQYPLGACNLINSDIVHEDCRCLYRDCRKPLLDGLDWRRLICPVCWAAGGGEFDPYSGEPVFSPCQACGGKAHDVTNVNLRPLPRRAA
jgi:hypothetical protein